MTISVTGGQPRSLLSDEDRIKVIRDDFDRLTPTEQQILIKILDDPDEVAKILNRLEDSEYIRSPIQFEEWLEDDYYLGHIGKTLYSVWKDDLIELFTGNYDEAVITGSIGSGKNTMTGVAMARMIYEMSCLRDPQLTFRLEEGSEISFACISLNERLAKRAVFGSIKSKITSSRYFMEQFPFKQTQRELRFPNNIQIAASSSAISSALSLNTFGGILDEVNFMPATPPRVEKIRHGSRRTGERTSHAETLYRMLLRRMKSRYSIDGKIPGILMIISSRAHKEAFTERRIAEAANDHRIFVRSYALWEAKPRILFSSETFYVLVGNEQIQSRIVDTNDDRLRLEKFIGSDPSWADSKIIEVPNDFRMDFEKNLEEALQDLAGIATLSISPFIQRRESVYACIDKERTHPMPHVEWNPKDQPHIDWSKLVKTHTVKDRRGNESHFRGPIVSPTAMRHVHIDTSLNKDSTGICIGHTFGQTEITRRDHEGNEFTEQAPLIYVDFMLRVIPPPGEDIILADIRTLLYSFMDQGYKFGLCTTDSYQSVEMRQYMELQRGVETKLLSVDKTTDPYKELRSAMYEGRIRYYHYQPFLYEIQRVIHDKVKRKVDHPDGGSKDVADAVAGVTFSLTGEPSHMPMMPTMGISEFDDPEDKDKWIRGTMDSSGEKPVVEHKASDGWFMPIQG